MKKLLALFMVLFVAFWLTSCFKEATYKEVMSSNKKEIAKDFYNVFGPLFQSGESNWTIKFQMSENSWSNIKVDSIFSGNTDIENWEEEINLSINASSNLGGSELTAVADVDFITSQPKGEIYAKLNELTLGWDAAAMLEIMTAGIEKDVWFRFIDEELTKTANYKEEFEKIHNAFDLGLILTLKKQNENKDFYDYDVEINEVELQRFLDVLAESIGDNSMNLSFDKEKFAGVLMNLKVNKKDRSYFELTMTDTSSENAKLVIANTESVVSFEFIDSKGPNASIIIEKGGNGIYDVFFNYQEMPTSDKMSIAFNIELKENYQSIKLGSTPEMTSALEKEGIKKLVIEIVNNFNKKPVSIDLPTEFKDFEELMQGAF